MATIRKDFVYAAYRRAYTLFDGNIQNNIDEEHKLRKQEIINDESLSSDEKSEAIKLLIKDFDFFKLLDNEGKKRICENCQSECLAISFCEHCVRNYLETKFSNWTSGNDDIDNIIKKCQMETISPSKVVEWIPYNKLENVKYLTKGGCSEIYTADWIDGRCDEWDSKEKELKRFGNQKVILKRLENVKSANRSWFEESKSHMSISIKSRTVVTCYGLTKDPSDGNYMLVINMMNMNLRNYLQQNHNKLTWNIRIQIAKEIIYALSRIHQENAIHRDLHSGNILFSQSSQGFLISDLGFCGPADKPLNSIYGNLPYIAPEVIAGKQTTFASDIYSIGMLMWEISSGEPPFNNYENDYDLAMKIINGMRPKIASGTPLKYLKLMEQCWDADPEKRPNVYDLSNEIQVINKSYHQNKNKEQQITHNLNINNLQFDTNFNSSIIDSLIRNFNSKIYNFKDFPEPRNSTKEEQGAYHDSKQNDLNISSNIILFENQTDEQNNSIIITDNDNNELKEKSKRIKRIHPNNSDDEKDDNSRKVNKLSNDKEDDETYNNPNLHSEDQEELGIPED